jgi:hypothetical protein
MPGGEGTNSVRLLVTPGKRKALAKSKANNRGPITICFMGGPSVPTDLKSIYIKFQQWISGMR